MNSNLFLENKLAKLASGDPEADKLLHSYRAVKEYLEREYYGWIQANCPYYTEHGQPHISSVITSAGMLLGNSFKTKRTALTAMDLYVILGAIIWHDVGNVIARRGHAEAIVPMTTKIRTIAFPSVPTYNAVVRVAQAHSGAKGLSVVSSSPNIVHTSGAAYPVDLKALAAIVRFADEISENQTRISQEILASGNVPKDSLIYWEYANCVLACYPDLERDRIVVDYHIDRTKAARRYRCDDKVAVGRVDSDGCITLIEYVLCRLEKMNEERSYCAAEFRAYAAIRQIEARFTLVDDTAPTNSLSELEIVLRDSGLQAEGFPKIEVVEPFFKDHPDWRPEAITRTLTNNIP